MLVPLYIAKCLCNFLQTFKFIIWQCTYCVHMSRVVAGR